jgi:hypothetical protein
MTDTRFFNSTIRDALIECVKSESEYQNDGDAPDEYYDECLRVLRETPDGYDLDSLTPADEAFLDGEGTDDPLADLKAMSPAGVIQLQVDFFYGHWVF